MSISPHDDGHGATRDGSPKPPRWPIALAGAALVATWRSTGDAGLAIELAMLILTAFRPGE